MLNFCTLFDINYLPYGLNMYNSLKEHCTSFCLYVFAFDNEVYTKLKELNYDNLVVISLNEFENEDLLKIKPTRTRAEYCWTCTPSTILYCLEKFKLENCTYLDADIYFFNNPQILIDEVANKSVIITEHRFSKEYEKAIINGRFCVQFMYFRNDISGLKVLNWWKDRCNEWCYNRIEGDKFGDQKYLDKWPTIFEKEVHILNNLGGGVAPWNVQQYNFSINHFNKIDGIEISSNIKFDLIFYHFHGLKIINNNKIELCEYKINESAKTHIYYHYIKELYKLRKIHNVNTIFAKKLKFTRIIKTELIKLAKNYIGNYQVYNLENIINNGTFNKS